MKRRTKFHASATEQTRNAVEEYFKLKDLLVFGEPEAQQKPAGKPEAQQKPAGKPAAQHKPAGKPAGKKRGFPPRYGAKIQSCGIGLLPGEKDFVMRFLQILRDYKYGEINEKR
ncbi:MAG: hypothetical protein ACI4CY_05720 [Candidatus Gastranaerophilaceae bacterium]